jgi:hypothetical protein
MQQKNYTQGAVEEYRETRRNERKVHTERKRDHAKQECIQHLGSLNETGAFY